MTDETPNPKRPWTNELTDELLNVVGGVQPVVPDTITAAATMLGMSERRISSKLRKIGIDVQSMAKTSTSTFSAQQTLDLQEFITNNSGELTYRDISQQFPGGFTPKQIQGKILAMELTDHVKAAPPVVRANEYSVDDSDKYIQMAKEGFSLESIAEALGRELPSIRGKGLSLHTAGLIDAIPTQENTTVKVTTVSLADIEGVEDMTVADIAILLNRTERGVKTSLTRQAVNCKDYKGVIKNAKASAKRDKAD